MHYNDTILRHCVRLNEHFTYLATNVVEESLSAMSEVCGE